MWIRNDGRTMDEELKREDKRLAREREDTKKQKQEGVRERVKSKAVKKVVEV